MVIIIIIIIIDAANPVTETGILRQKTVCGAKVSFLAKSFARSKFCVKYAGVQSIYEFTKQANISR